MSGLSHVEVTIPPLCIRCTLQLGTVSLPRTANPDHMRSNAESAGAAVLFASVRR